MRRLRWLAVVSALALGACGGGSTGTGPAVGPPTARAPDATAPPPDATQPGTGPVTTATTAPPAGGEQAVRVPAAFAATDGRLVPPTITVPPFLAVELSLRSADGRPHRLVLRTPTPQALAVAAGGRAAVRIAGLRAGRYPVALDGRRAGTLVAGGEVGP